MTQQNPPLLPGPLDLIVLQLLHGEPTSGDDLTQREVDALTAAGRKHLREQRESWERFSDELTAVLRTA